MRLSKPLRRIPSRLRPCRWLCLQALLALALTAAQHPFLSVTLVLRLSSTISCTVAHLRRRQACRTVPRRAIVRLRPKVTSANPRPANPARLCPSRPQPVLVRHSRLSRLREGSSAVPLCYLLYILLVELCLLPHPDFSSLLHGLLSLLSSSSSSVV